MSYSYQRPCDGHPGWCARKPACGNECHFNCAEVETPHDKAARHFWEPNAALHIDVYTGPSRLNRCLDWLGNTAEAAKQGFVQAFRDAWSVISHPWMQFAVGAVLAVFTCWLAVEMFIAMWNSR